MTGELSEVIVDIGLCSTESMDWLC